CGASGVMQMASTLGLMIGPPAATLYAVEPLGVETMMPSPKQRTPGSLSVPSSSSIMRNGAPEVMTESFNAVELQRRFSATSVASDSRHSVAPATTDTTT